MTANSKLKQSGFRLENREGISVGWGQQNHSLLANVLHKSNDYSKLTLGQVWSVVDLRQILPMHNVFIWLPFIPRQLGRNLNTNSTMLSANT